MTRALDTLAVMMLLATAWPVRAADADADQLAEKSGQSPSGTITFLAADAQVHSPQARYDADQRQLRIEAGSAADDFVSWDYEATRPGTYELRVNYSSQRDAEVPIVAALGKVELAGKLPRTVDSTLTNNLFGKAQIPAAGKILLTIRRPQSDSSAAIHVKAITLTPVSEGQPIVQAADGSITCHARDVTIHGVKVQYEPKPEKNTVGFWVNPADTVSWEFEVTKPGRFEIEILQGCGQGAGDSEVELSVDGQPLKFTVQDTGHFQNFVARRIGTVEIAEAGKKRLEVRPLRMAHFAVMDLRQVRLIPVTEPK